jgi:hypothetical protein
MKYTRTNNKTKHTRRNRDHRRRRTYLGGSSFEQKGVAAQLRSSAPHNSALRKKLNEIVHSGDFYESKERNGFLNLDNDFDPEAQNVLIEAIDYIKSKQDLSSKIKKRVLQGIAPVATTSTTRTNSHKTSTKRARTRTPTKNTITTASTMTTSLNSRNKSKSRNMTRRRSKSMF